MSERVWSRVKTATMVGVIGSSAQTLSLGQTTLKAQ
jgi:hypothetical protein